MNFIAFAHHFDFETKQPIPSPPPSFTSNLATVTLLLYNLSKRNTFQNIENSLARATLNLLTSILLSDLYTGLQTHQNYPMHASFSHLYCNIHCVRKKRPTRCFVISSIKLRRFWWNLTHSFLNKFAAKICKCFQPDLNNVSTLPCETWNPHHAGATTALSDKETPEFVQSQLWYPNSPDLNPDDHSVWGILQEKVYKIRMTDLDELKQTENRVGQAGSCRHCGSHLPVVSAIAPYQFASLATLSNAVINWIQIWRI